MLETPGVPTAAGKGWREIFFEYFWMLFVPYTCLLHNKQHGA
jgi:hypothetical protein